MLPIATASISFIAPHRVAGESRRVARWSRVITVLLCLLGMGLAQASAPTDTPPPAPARPKPELKIFTSPASANTPPAAVLWTESTTPAAFLHSMGARIKARWRQLYRQPPPIPATERSHAAFSLGALLADSFLALEATDGQQYRNTGQDILAYSRVLGIGEKMHPRVMSQAKLAAEEKWPELTQDTVDGHQQFIRVLHEMRDGDLAVLVDLGLWLRMIEISATMVSQVPDAKAHALCIGHPALVRSLSSHFIQITAKTQKDDRIKWVGEFIDYLQRYGEVGQEPDEASAAKVLEKVSSLMTKLTLK
jgi:hypothetical protein